MSNKEVILNYILEATCHPTADEVYQHLRAQGRKLTLATVYNNLHALCGEGRIRSLALDPKSERFDKPLRHDHLVCRHCGEIRDLRLTDLTEQLRTESGFWIDGYELKLFYSCEACSQSAHV